MKLFLLTVVSLSVAACGIRPDEQTRKVVPPKGSDDSTMPWNVPTQGSGGGLLGGLLNR